MLGVLYNVVHVIGTAVILMMISYLFVDLFKKKKVTVMEIVSHTLVLVILFFTLLRS